MSNYKVDPQVTPESSIIKVGKDLIAVAGRYSDSEIVVPSGGAAEDWYLYKPQSPVDFNNQSLINLPTPSGQNDATTKTVCRRIGGLNKLYA